MLATAWAECASAADLAPAPPAIETDEFDARWHFAAGAYVWAAGIDGSVGVGGLGPADVEADFLEILENLDLAFMAVAEARYDRFGVFADLVYTHLSADGSGPLGLLDASITNEMFVGTVMGQVRALQHGNSSLDLMAGARLWAVSGELELTGPLGGGGRRDLDEVWVDPMIGAKGRVQGTSPWYATGWAMIGGFGASADIDWDALAAIGYEVNNHVSLLAGYRGLGVEYENEDFVFDIVQHGPLVSAIVRF